MPLVHEKTGPNFTIQNGNTFLERIRNLFYPNKKDLTKMILIFGGTTEGKQVIEVLQQLRLPHIYSTKTEIDVVLGECGKYRHGAFSSRRLEKFIRENNITMIVHASHPFATELHQTISGASINCKIPVFIWAFHFKGPSFIIFCNN